MTAKHLRCTAPWYRTGGWPGAMNYEYPAIAIHQATGQGIFFTPEERQRHVYIVGKSGSGAVLGREEPAFTQS
jgi:hypothetical protein